MILRIILLTLLLILLILSVCAIWRDALRSEKQNENTNE